MLRALQQGTSTLINQESVDIQLTRQPAWEQTEAGGVRRSSGAADILDSQSFFFGEVRSDAVEVRSDRGEAVVLRHVLIGPADADVEEGDSFSVGGRSFKVEYINPNREYQTKAYVSERV